jgi:hypothetical protein
MRARTQLSSNTLQEFTTVIQQLVQWALIRLPKNFTLREAPYMFIDGITLLIAAIGFSLKP